MQRGLKPQMKYADKIGARYTVVLGDNEIQSGKANVKCMQTGEQIEIPFEEFDQFLKETRK